jgi:hypothetical protein
MIRAKLVLSDPSVTIPESAYQMRFQVLGNGWIGSRVALVVVNAQRVQVSRKFTSAEIQHGERHPVWALRWDLAANGRSASQFCGNFPEQWRVVFLDGYGYAFAVLVNAAVGDYEAEDVRLSGGIDSCEEVTVGAVLLVVPMDGTPHRWPGSPNFLRQ